MKTNKIILSQSFIKAMNHGMDIPELEDQKDVKCPAKAQAVYLHGYKSLPSEAMNYGNFLETILWGATGDGEVATIPRKNDGITKKVVQTRIEQQAYLLKNRWMKEMGMTDMVLHPTINVSLGERYVFRARMDFYSSMVDGNEYHPRVIGDLKLTQSIHTTFGPFAWGAPQTMDHTQAVAYSWAYAQKYKEWVPFYYVVLSHGKVGDYLKVRVMMDNLKVGEFKLAMSRTVDLIENYSASGKPWPKIPSDANCKGCPIKNTCEMYRIGGRTVKVY